IVTKVASLARASRGQVLGVEIEHEVAPGGEVVQLPDPSGGVGEFEVGRRLAFHRMGGGCFALRGFVWRLLHIIFLPFHAASFNETAPLRPARKKLRLVEVYSPARYAP